MEQLEPAGTTGEARLNPLKAQSNLNLRLAADACDKLFHVEQLGGATRSGGDE